MAARSRAAVAPSPICGFELSRSGELLAAVTPDGEGWGRGGGWRWGRGRAPEARVAG